MNIHTNLFQPRTSPMGGAGPMLNGLPGMGIPGMSLPGMGFGGCDQVMSSMMMLAMGQMMMMMTQMIAQNGGSFPINLNPTNFGGPPGMDPCGPTEASPLNGFLGGGGPSSMNGGGTPWGSGLLAGRQQRYDRAANGTVGSDGTKEIPSPVGPGGKVGNVDINTLVQALPPARRKSAQKHFPYIVAEAQKQGVTNKNQLSYILATATHESGAGAFMEEFASGRKYEGRRSLGNTETGDGVKFKGRGYVQLTGRRNYADWSRRLGVDLTNNPDKVKDPAVAAKILVGGMKAGTFTGKRLDSYINDQKTDYSGARKTVNGTDKAGQIADIARRLEAAMS